MLRKIKQSFFLFQVQKQGNTCPKVSPGIIFSDESEAEIEMEDNYSDKKIDLEKFNVIDVCSNRKLFDTFQEELKNQKFISMSLACDKIMIKPIQSGGIGQRITRRTSKKTEVDKDPFTLENDELRIIGAAFSFVSDDHLTSYFVSLVDDIKKHAEHNDTIAPGSQDSSISVDDKLKLIKMGLETQKVAIFDLKTFLRICYLGLDIIQDGDNDKYFDPKVAAWILKPGENEMTLATLVMTYRPGLYFMQKYLKFFLTASFTERSSTLHTLLG